MSTEANNFSPPSAELKQLRDERIVKVGRIAYFIPGAIWALLIFCLHMAAIALEMKRYSGAVIVILWLGVVATFPIGVLMRKITQASVESASKFVYWCFAWLGGLVWSLIFSLTLRLIMLGVTFFTRGSVGVRRLAAQASLLYGWQAAKLILIVGVILLPFHLIVMIKANKFRPGQPA